MQISFYKYHGTGNDFILIDNRDALVELNSAGVAALCHRRFGIGADGLILLGKSGADHTMTYYNSDGGLSTMCGNGGRCITAFARQLMPDLHFFRFRAADGYHEAHITGIIEGGFVVSLGMSDVSDINKVEGDYILNTGSPHLVKFTDDPDAADFLQEARKIRYNERFSKDGININFVTINKEGLSMRTYERGVEDETLSCGTGTVAAALAFLERGNFGPGSHTVEVKAPGGCLTVQAEKAGNRFTGIRLTGPAVMVYKGFLVSF